MYQKSVWRMFMWNKWIYWIALVQLFTNSAFTQSRCVANTSCICWLLGKINTPKKSYMASANNLDLLLCWLMLTIYSCYSSSFTVLYSWQGRLLNEDLVCTIQLSLNLYVTGAYFCRCAKLQVQLGKHLENPKLWPPLKQTFQSDCAFMPNSSLPSAAYLMPALGLTRPS